MAIELTIRQMVAMAPALGNLYQQKFPVAASYRISKLIRLVRKELDEFDAARIAVIRERGLDQALPDDASEDEKAARAEALAELNKEVEELLDEKVVIETNRIAYMDVQSIEMTPQDVEALEPVLELPSE